MSLDKLNEFSAYLVGTMDKKTKEAYNSLSEFEKKIITATAFFFKENINNQNLERLLNV